MITFNSIKSINRGQILDILVKSYQELINKYDLKNKANYLNDWKNTDKNSFDYPDTIGKCVLVTYLDDKLIGFISYDPRNFPRYGIVGQNCILPEFKDKGYGKMQIEQLLNIFREQKCKKALVSTGDIDFFIPAQKMYKSLGFKEVKRQANKKWGYQEIKYEKIL